MPSIRYRSIIDASIDQTRMLLFPIRFKKWLIWFFIILFSGHLSGLTGIFSHLKDSNFVFSKYITQMVSSQDANSEKQVPENSNFTAAFGWNWQDLINGQSTSWMWLGMLLIFMFYIFASWWSAHFDFILMEAVKSNQPNLFKSFFSYPKASRSLFLWNLVMGGSSALSALPIFASLFKWLTSTSLYFHDMYGGATGFGFGVLFWAIVTMAAFLFPFVLVNMLTTDLVVPIMFRFQIGVLEGWKKLFSKMKEQPFEFIKYIFIKLFLFVLCILYMVFVFLFILFVAMMLFFFLFIAFSFLTHFTVLPQLKTGVLALILGIFCIPFVTVATIGTGVLFFRVFSILTLQELLPELIIFPRSITN